MNPSQFKFFSLGVSAVNKRVGSSDLEVWPIEQAPLVQGEITDMVQTYRGESKDSSGKAFSSKVDTTISFKATWLPIGQSNRITPPDVMRGESLIIYQYADDDKYYWDTSLTNHKLRTLETALYAWKATKNHGEDLTPDNSYFLRVSSHDKSIQLKTSSVNGEAVRYTITLNLAEGFFTAMDDRGNVIQIASMQDTISAETSQGGRLEMNKRIFTVDCDEIRMNAADSITAVAPSTSVKSNTAFEGALTSNGKNISDSHTHGGVRSGGSSTAGVN